MISFAKYFVGRIVVSFHKRGLGGGRSKLLQTMSVDVLILPDGRKWPNWWKLVQRIDYVWSNVNFGGVCVNHQLKEFNFCMLERIHIFRLIHS